MEYVNNKTLINSVNNFKFDILDGAYTDNSNRRDTSEISLPCPRIYFFENGKAEFLSNGKKTETASGYVCIIPEGLTFCETYSANCSNIYFQFRATLSDGSNLFANTNDILSTFAGNERISRIKRLFFSENEIDIIRLKNEILSIILSMYPSDNSSEQLLVIYSPMIQQITNYIKDNLSIQLSGEALSKHFGIPSTTLAKRFKKEVGMTVGKYIDNLVFDAAKRMLVSGQYSIKQISDTLGFCDRFYFSRRFKSKFSMTPHKYKTCSSSL